MALYNVILKNTGNGATVYNENMSFSKEPTVEDITDFISFIMPNLKYDWIDWSYVGELDKKTGKLIPDKEVY